MSLRREEGIALLVAMMAMLLMSALGVALVLTATTETGIAANFRVSREGLYAADAAVERVMGDLQDVRDWNTLLDGSVRSTFVDGPPSGSRTLPDGSRLDLNQAANIVNCPKNRGAACSAGDMNAVTGDRPWGANNPQWKLYAYGRLADLLPGGVIDSPYYVIVLVADDPMENDGDPLRDGATACKPAQAPAACNPGAGLIVLQAEAFGPRGAYRAIEIAVMRTQKSARISAWREMR